LSERVVVRAAALAFAAAFAFTTIAAQGSSDQVGGIDVIVKCKGQSPPCPKKPLLSSPPPTGRGLRRSVERPVVQTDFLRSRAILMGSGG
jgi:hypothetical protein